MVGQAHFPAEQSPCEHMLIERNDGSIRMLVRTLQGIGSAEIRRLRPEVERAATVRHFASFDALFHPAAAVGTSATGKKQPA